MQEFTPETLENFISQRKEKRDPDIILKNLQSKKEHKTSNNTHNFLNPHISELDMQIRNNFVEIIRHMVKNNRIEDLKSILEEHKNFLDNILKELIKK